MIDAVIDISHFQGTPDFDKVKASGVAGVIHKATQGIKSSDSTFAAAKKSIPAAGLLLGAYHFGTGDGTGAQQAQWFLDTTEPDAKTLCVIDFEPNPSGTSMNLTQLIDWIDTVAEKTGRKPVVYGGKSLLFSSVGASTNDTLAKCALWVAQYTSAAQPSSIPTQIWPQWTLWQYTESGSVDGITTAVDRDRFNGTLDELTTWWCGG
ncbi:MAG TPA: glycoside hydrolase family 25 protein [Thermoanaerobaculia bacterium]|nr:glycoside hydrolase family 25 protein [Thermoanaerobaculia bacterium]